MCFYVSSIALMKYYKIFNDKFESYEVIYSFYINNHVCQIFILVEIKKYAKDTKTNLRDS